MALFNFEALSFHSLPLIRRISYGGGVWEVWFERPFNFVSGQICAIHTGVASEARLYSIASGQNQGEIGFLYNEVAGGLLTPLLTRAEIGTPFFISPPFGDFILKNEPATWIATGTGIAPFLSASRSGLNLSNKTLIHGARTLESFLGQETLEKVFGKYVRCCSACREGSAEIYAGRLTAYLAGGASVLGRGKVYLCGNSQMVVDVREILVDAGLDLDNLICEVYF